jgi:hypothetical protein
MFKIVNPRLPDTVMSIPTLAAVDVQLVGDDLANDTIFVREKSIVRTGAPRGVYTYVTLQDAIQPRELDAVREVIFRVLSSLVDGVSFMCFMQGRVPEDEVSEFENRVVIGAWHEEMRMSGRVIIAEMDLDDLKYCLKYFGNDDTMRGVALTPEGAAGMHADLRLFEPLPTTDDSSFFQSPKYNAIQIALKHGAFFFEEIGNGTRLRIVSTTITQDDLTGRIAALIQ